MAGEVNQATLEAIRGMINQAVTQAISTLPPGPQGPQGPIGPVGAPGPPGLGGNGSGNNNTGFRVQEIGFFDPYLDQSIGKGEVVHSGSDTYIRNVHVFTDRIRDAARLHGKDYIKARIP